jgi:hypothetical protein
MKRKCNFRRQAVAPEVSKNQGHFKEVFTSLHYVKPHVNTLLHSLLYRLVFKSDAFSFSLKKRNAITKKFTATSLKYPNFQTSQLFIIHSKNQYTTISPQFLGLILKKRNAIMEKFTTNSVERPFQLHFEINLISE